MHCRKQQTRVMGDCGLLSTLDNGFQLIHTLDYRPKPPVCPHTHTSKYPIFGRQHTHTKWVQNVHDNQPDGVVVTTVATTVTNSDSHLHALQTMMLIKLIFPVSLCEQRMNVAIVIEAIVDSPKCYSTLCFFSFFFIQRCCCCGCCAARNIFCFAFRVAYGAVVIN